MPCSVLWKEGGIRKEHQVIMGKLSGVYPYFFYSFLYHCFPRRRKTVGLRERVRKDTLTLRLRRLSGMPGPFRLRGPGTAASRRRGFAFPSPPALAIEGVRGESFPPAGSGAEPRCLCRCLSRGTGRSPACLSCLSSLLVLRFLRFLSSGRGDGQKKSPGGDPGEGIS